MPVKLIAHTQPADFLPCNTMLEFTAYCARVSNPTNQANNKTAPKLIRYLINQKHWSPLQMVNLVFEIKCPRDVSRQIIRHRSLQVQEYSQRYAETDAFMHREARMQDDKNRQNSLTCDDNELSEWWDKEQNKCLKQNKILYQEALAKGIAKEVARAVLPEGLTETTIIANGTLRDWYHYCELRTDPATQLEHQQIASRISDIINEIFSNLIKETLD